MSVHTRITTDQIQTWKARFPEAVKRAIKKSLSPIEDMGKSMTPKDSGELARSLVVSEMPYGIKMEWTAPYAKIVDKGSPPHVIKPKTLKALHFEGREGPVWAKKVNHPGYPGWNFRPDIRRQALAILKAAILDELAGMI